MRVRPADRRDGADFREQKASTVRRPVVENGEHTLPGRHDGTPVAAGDQAMHDNDAAIAQLLETLNASERSPSRRRRGLALDAVGALCASGGEGTALVDRARSGVLSRDADSHSITLRGGRIIGRGLFGDGPSKDLPGAVNSRIWRLWEVRWDGEALVCLRCGHEWEPARPGRPEQCPECLGILAADSDDEDTDGAAGRHGTTTLEGWV